MKQNSGAHEKRGMLMYGDEIYHRSGRRNVDLCSLCPISRRYVCKQIILPLIGLAFIGSLYLIEKVLNAGSLYGLQWVQPFAKLTFFVLLGYTSIKLLYWELYRFRYKYLIERGHLVISKGVILRESGLFPLSRITDVYLEYSPGDLLFGLRNVRFATPTTHSATFARVDGLPPGLARKLQETVTKYLEVIPDTDINPAPMIF